MNQTHTQSMTEGSPLRLILLFSVPLLIGNLFQQFYNVVDIVVAGHCLGDRALAAIGATSSFYHLLLGFATGMNTGFGILVSRSFGAKDPQKIKQAVAGSLMINLLFSALFVLFSLRFIRPLLQLLQTPPEIIDQSVAYVSIILAGMPVTILYNMEACVLRALGNSRTPLIFLIIASIGNIFLDLLLIAGFHMDVRGAAIATVLAQLISVILCLIHILRGYPELHLDRTSFRVAPAFLLELLTTGLSMGFMNSIYAIGSVTLQGAINGLGTTIITAHTAARKILEVGMSPLSSISLAASTFVSQNFGAQKLRRIGSGIKTSCYCCYAWSGFFFLFLIAFGGPLVQTLTGTSDSSVIANAILNLRINAPFYFFLGPLVVLRNALQSMGHRIIPLFSSSIEMVVKLFAAAVLVPSFGYAGASIAEPSTWLFCMVFLCILYGKTEYRAIRAASV